MALSNNIDEFNPELQPQAGFDPQTGAASPVPAPLPPAPQPGGQGAPAPGLPAPGNAAGPMGFPALASSPLSPQGALAAMGQSRGNQVGATALEAQNQAAGKLAESGIYQDSAAEQTRQLQEQQAAKQKAQEQADARAEQIRSMVLDTYNQKIDPDRYWNNKSTEGKVTAGIGMILGGIGQGFLVAGGAKGAGNVALDIIQKAIDRDIESQRANIETRLKSIDKLQGLNKDDHQRSLDYDIWKTQQRMAGLAVVETKIKSMAAKTTSESVKNNALNEIEKINQLQIQDRAKLGAQIAAAQAAGAERLRKQSAEANKNVQELVNTGKMSPEEARREVYSRPEFQQLAANGMAPKEFNEAYADRVTLTKAAQARYKELEKQKGFLSKEAYEKGMAALNQEYKSGLASIDDRFKASSVVPDIRVKTVEEGTKAEKDARERTVIFDGKEYQARSKEQADKFNNDAAALAEVQRNVAILKSIRAKNQGGTLNQDDAYKDNMARNNIVGLLGKAQGAGVLSEKEYKRMMEQLQSSTDFNLPWKDVNSRLDSMSTDVNGKLKTLFEVHVGSGVKQNSDPVPANKIKIDFKERKQP